MVLILLGSQWSSSQHIELKIELKNYLNDTLIVGNYFGEKSIVNDTIISKDHSKFVWKPGPDIKPGMYLLLIKPSNNFVQFFVNGKDTDMTMIADVKSLSDIKFKGSPENEAFMDYLRFLKEKRPVSDTLKARIARAVEKKSKDEESIALFDKLDREVKEHQKALIAKFPNSVFSLLLTSSVDIQLPEFEGDEKEIQRKRYNYYRSHFFDNLDLKHPAVIRTPFLHPKIDQYITKLTSQEPDSIILAVDYLLKRLEHDPEAYRYYLADFLNKYAQMKIVGQDAIYVHMVDTYYRKGKAPWLKEENLKKMEENANDLRPILINKIIPDITTYKQDGSAINLHSVQAQYTVVIFWAPDCGHCKQIMPSVVKFEENNRDKGLKIFAVCTKGGDKTTTCWPAIEEKKMQNFINTADEYGRFNQQIRIKTTPKIFILDSKKKIIMKDISGEDLEKIFNDIYDHDQKAKIEVK
jgi:thiol-disulfide isomerase/thioredoxin